MKIEENAKQERRPVMHQEFIDKVKNGSDQQKAYSEINYLVSLINKKDIVEAKSKKENNKYVSEINYLVHQLKEKDNVIIKMKKQNQEKESIEIGIDKN